MSAGCWEGVFIALSKVSHSDTSRGIAVFSFNTRRMSLRIQQYITQTNGPCTGLELITQIFVERLTQCANHFQPLVTYEYFSKNRALKQHQFYALMFRGQLHNHNKTGNARTVTQRRFRENTVAVEKKYLIFWVYVCSVRYAACNVHSPYCHLWPVRLYNIFLPYPKIAWFSKKKGILWCWNLDISGSRSETPGKFWNVVLEEDGKDQLDWSCEKWRCTT